MELTAYNPKTREKKVPILDAVITRTKQGAYLVKGYAANGDKLTTLVNKANAEAAVESGHAKMNEQP